MAPDLPTASSSIGGTGWTCHPPIPCTAFGEGPTGEMRMYMTHDHPLIDHGQRRVQSAYWLIPSLSASDLVTRLARKVATGRGSVVRWSSQFVRREIHVSPMSGTWLRMYEAEYDKRGVEA